MSRAVLRLFVAAYPTPDAALWMLDQLQSLRLPPHRPTPQDQVHLTLQFIGDTAPGELPSVLETVRCAAAGIERFTLRAHGLISLPERGPARLVAAETDSPAPLMELQGRLAHRLARNPRARADERFRPHMTLARFRSAARGVRISHMVAGMPFVVDRVRVMRSVLQPQGAIHDCIEQVPLTDPR